MENANIRMIPVVPITFSKRNICCGIIFVVLHAIAWPSFVVWILIDVGLLSLLILPRILPYMKKTFEVVNNMIPGSVKNERGGFNSVMPEASDSHTRHASDGRVRSSGRRPRYNHEFSRCTPDQRDTRTPFPTISAIRNRLSYSTAEASIRTTPTALNRSATSTLQERNRASRNPSTRSAHHSYTPDQARSSSVLHIARTNLPVAREACSPVIVKVAPLGTSPRLDLVEPKQTTNTCSKDVVVNALKQITQKRKRVYPLSDSREDDSSFLDSLPSVKKSRQEPTAQQTMKRTWTTAAITNESFSKPPMPETKKHKASSDIGKAPPPSLVPESMVIEPSSSAVIQTEVNHVEKDREETASSTDEVIQILNTSDKENKSLDSKNQLLNEQKNDVSFGILKKLRTVYPSSKPSVDAMRRKYPILCSSGVAPKLGRQSLLKLKHEDYVKDREDVYAKVKRVFEEVDEAESQKKKKEEKPTVTTEPVAVKSVSSALPVPHLNVTTTSAPLQSAEVTTTKALPPSIVSTTPACSTMAAPPPNVVISSTLSEIIPTASSSTGQQPSIVLPVPTIAKLASKPPEAAVASSTVSNNNLTIPTMPSMVSIAANSTSQQTFNFKLPSALSTANTTNSQPMLNFSRPVSSTTSSSTAGLGIPSSLGAGTALKVPSSSGTGLKLQLPTSTTAITNTIQLQTNLSQRTNTAVTSTGQFGLMFNANVGTNINLPTAGTKTSYFPSLATVATTNVVKSSGNLFTTSAGDSNMIVASLPQTNSVFSTTLNTNFTSSNQVNVGVNNNFTGLFASGGPANSVGNTVIASSASGTKFGNLFGNRQTTIINTGINTTTTTTTTCGQPFIFNIFQPSHTATAPSNPAQLAGQVGLATFPSTSTPFNQPSQTQTSNSGFNFMAANTTNASSNFSFNLQASVGDTNSSLLFNAPPGGFNLPSTAITQSRRKTKTPTRSKPKRK